MLFAQWCHANLQKFHSIHKKESYMACIPSPFIFTPFRLIVNPARRTFDYHLHIRKYNTYVLQWYYLIRTNNILEYFHCKAAWHIGRIKKIKIEIERAEREKCQHSKNIRATKQMRSYYVWIHLSHVNMRIRSTTVCTFYLLSFSAKRPTRHRDGWAGIKIINGMEIVFCFWCSPFHKYTT